MFQKKYRNFEFNLETSSIHYFWLKKHLQVHPETRSYDFLTKTHEKKKSDVPKYPRSGEHLRIIMLRSLSVEKSYVLFASFVVRRCDRENLSSYVASVSDHRWRNSPWHWLFPLHTSTFQDRTREIHDSAHTKSNTQWEVISNMYKENLPKLELPAC